MRDWEMVRSTRTTWGSGNGADGRKQIGQAWTERAEVGRVIGSLNNRIIGSQVENQGDNGGGEGFVYVWTGTMALFASGVIIIVC